MSDRIRIADTKPYDVPSSLEALHGPGLGGVLHLGHEIIWAPHSQTIHLATLDDATFAYTAIINEATAADQERLLNKDLLLEVWPALTLPWRVYELWEERFPELPRNELSHAFLQR
ncbi:transcriptional regulator [Trueperella bialowiezensis]|uniref:Uncharacterized protein n=1 Tax=Trueperella bialowiezensis TaxID=312285 RepID=A0A3S4X654_9ACTO|nr:transcriptional regulator [Trueperella bialowiezensis]VEI13477.1 Uncharacterised protein [Trueperella bialowiezensis]